MKNNKTMIIILAVLVVAAFALFFAAIKIRSSQKKNTGKQPSQTTKVTETSNDNAGGDIQSQLSTEQASINSPTAKSTQAETYATIKTMVSDYMTSDDGSKAISDCLGDVELSKKAIDNIAEQTTTYVIQTYSQEQLVDQDAIIKAVTESVQKNLEETVKKSVLSEADIKKIAKEAVSGTSKTTVQGMSEAEITNLVNKNVTNYLNAMYESGKLSPVPVTTASVPAQTVVSGKGEKGDKGDTGAQGAQGAQGAAGKDGVDGKNGENGKDGKDGVDGKDGKDGYTPQKGVDYFDGYTPQKGVDYYTIDDRNEIVRAVSYEIKNIIEDGEFTIYAEDGLSAYEVWLEANGIDPLGDIPSGYSEGDFFDSLKGSRGEDGVDGKDGKDGKDGEKGDKGDKGIDGLSAYEVWLEANGVDHTGTIPSEYSVDEFFKSLKGEKGDKGDNGQGGESVDFPYNINYQGGTLLITKKGN